MLENSGACLKAAGLIVLLSPIRLMKRFVRVSPPSFVARHVQAPAMQSEFRQKLQPVQRLIERSGIEEGMTVMELGCGTGLYTIDFATAIGKEGKLYAVDIRPEYIDILKRRLEKPEYKDINNIETKLASAYDLPFQDDSIDLVIMVGVLNEMTHKGKALGEIHRILKPSGILAVSELLIDPDYPLRRTHKKYCERRGYKLVDASGSFFNYTLRFMKVG